MEVINLNILRNSQGQLDERIRGKAEYPVINISPVEAYKFSSILGIRRLHSLYSRPVDNHIPLALTSREPNTYKALPLNEIARLAEHV
jgi:hypothetical protein